TIAPLYANEAITTGPIGRLLVAPPPSISTGSLTNNNGGGTIALAPAVLQQKNNLISVEFVGTFPDNNQPQPNDQPPVNDKFDFGPVTLIADGAGTSATIGSIDYANTKDGDQRGWLYDFDISGNAQAQQVLADLNATFRLDNAKYGNVL